MNIDEIREALRAAGLERLAEQVERLVLPAIKIDVQPVDEGELLVGASKIGGRPDLPPDVVWPTRGDIPLGFLAQFNLTEVAPYDVERVLPPAGMLYFFYDLQSEPYGLTPEQQTAWHVFAVDSRTNELLRMLFPHDLPHKSRILSYTVRLSGSMTLETDLSSVEPSGRMNRDGYLSYWRICDEAENHSQLLGHPRSFCAKMPLACELYASGHSYREVFRLTEGRLSR